ncbi:MAG: 5-formyltetrahydrofolate cyclo-ligase [Alphaproteobacteria bacterium]|nr:5-formyltetrahydrofolate cyclo-ligase [Alphaproteobacteria bacterium]
MTGLRREKQALRAALLARRAALTDADAAAIRLADRFPGPIDPAPRSVFAGFLPINDEIDILPLLRRLSAAGHDLVLPVVMGRGAPLTFRRWRDGDALETGPLGTRHPTSRSPALDPDGLLVPLLAFDRRGYRLGYGGGYYDRTLAALRRRRSVLAVGVGYSQQEVPAVPHGPQDEKLDWIVTDQAVIRAETEN